ncbi:phage holin family protein, partial [Klebsiella pneumoniae]|nr:phage holin family protein [Klebsiella pneumoniae]
MPDREPVSAPLRRLGASLLTLGRIRLELLAIEVQEEKEHIAQLVLWAVLAALLAGFAVMMLLVL